MDEQAALFWEQINQLIKAKKTTQEDLAKSLNIPFGTYRGWNSYKRPPDVFSGCHIAQALGVTVEYLVTGADGLTADERELLAVYRRIDDNNKAAAIGSVTGIAAAYPKKGDILSNSGIA